MSFSIIFVRVADERWPARLFSVILFLIVTEHRMSDSDNTQEPSDTPQEEQQAPQEEQAPVPTSAKAKRKPRQPKEPKQPKENKKKSKVFSVDVAILSTLMILKHHRKIYLILSNHHLRL